MESERQTLPGPTALLWRNAFGVRPNEDDPDRVRDEMWEREHDAY